MKKEIKYNTILSPFKWFILENFPYIEEDFDALTNWQLFCKLGKEMNKIIEKVNLTGEQVELLTNSFNALKDYIDNYFENLDVQEEINNKLDEMVEQGTLQEIISEYLNSTAIFGFDTVADMKSATNLIDGSYAKTLGYYEKNDGGQGLYKIRNVTNEDVEDNGSIIPLDNTNLVAELIENKINVKQFGAYGDNTYDDTTAFKNALVYINKTNEKTLYIPTGEYIISETLHLYAYNKIIGADKDNTRIFQKTGELLNEPIISTLNDTNNHNHILLKNIGIVLNGERTENAITIYNAFDFEMYNCFIQGTDSSKLNGLIITKNQNYEGEIGLCKIRNNRFSKSSITLNAGDSYIENNEIWGDGQDFAVKFMLYSTNTIIDSNQLIGGELYGALYFDDVGTKNNYQITNNYFDGSWNNIDTKYGIYCNTMMLNSIISNNKFWKQKAGAIFCLGCENTIISNNTFIDNDYYNEGLSDIQLGTNSTKVCFGNVITNNSFYRMKCLDANKENVIDRPNTSGKALDIYEQASSPQSIISNNTMTTEDKYTPATYTNGRNIIVNETNPKLIKSIIVTSYYTTTNKFDANTTTKDLKYFINNPNACSNIPTLTESGIFENTFVTTGYQFQTIKTKSHIYNRIQENGTWSNWFNVSLS